MTAITSNHLVDHPTKRSPFFLLCFLAAQDADTQRSSKTYSWPASQKDGVRSQAALVAEIILCPLYRGGKDMTPDYGPSSDYSLPMPLLHPHSGLVVGVEISDLRGSFQYDVP